MPKEKFIADITWRQEATYLDRLAGVDDESLSVEELASKAAYLSEDLENYKDE